MYVKFFVIFFTLYFKQKPGFKTGFCCLKDDGLRLKDEVKVVLYIMRHLR